MTLAAVSALALAAALLPASAMADEHDGPGARGFDRVCPAPEDASVADPADPDDIDGTTHQEAITCALDYGLAEGFDDGSYDPGRAVTRGQMATFVANWIRTATGAEFEDVGGDLFTDVAGTTHEDNINAIAGAGVVSGREDGTFGPNEVVTRGQMSVFIASAIDLADTLQVDSSLPPADDTDFFDDVPGTTFEAEINAIAGVGIVQGVGNDLYVPAAAVTRGQLATFLLGAADYLDRNQRWLPTAVVLTYTVNLSWENEVDDSGDDPVFGVGEEPATGQAIVEVDAFNGEMTVELDYAEITQEFDDSPGAHIHVGAIDENGGVVIGFATAAELAAGDGSLTTTVEEDIDTFRFAELIEDPDGFYVNVHNADFPAGAIRGQLPSGGQELLEASQYDVVMTGAAEIDDSGDVPVPGQGEVDATADATVVVDYVAGEIGYTVDLSGVTGPFDGGPGFHIHAGTSDENGPIVAFLATGDDVQAAADDDGVLTGTFTGAPASVLREIVDDPSAFYLNLHSDDFPAGAVRAQLG